MSDLYNIIAELCKQRGITVYKMCKDIGIRGSVLSDLKTGRKKGLSTDTLSKIADHFGVTVDYLLGDESMEKTPALTKKDERDIEKRLEAVLEDLESGQGSLAFSGEALDDETRELLIRSLRNSMAVGKALAKKKYTPKKYRKE